MTKYLLYLILGIIAAALCVGVFLLYRKASRTVRTRFLSALRSEPVFKFSVLMLAIVTCFAYTAVYLVRVSKYASAIITLNYSEASQGENTNGTRYNMREIICDDVLQRTIDKGGLEGVSVSDLKQCLTVEPLIQGNSYDENSYHISTEFYVQYSASSETDKYPSDTILQLLCSSYRDYYFDTYVPNFQVTVGDFEEETEDLDYMDKLSYLNKEANRVLYHMYGMMNVNSSFVSSDGSTFSAVAAKVNKLQSTQISDDLYSFILQNGLSSDSEAYIKRIEYLNKQQSIEKEKLEQEYKITNQAVSDYAEEMATVVLVPTRDSDGVYYMGRTKVGIDNLSQESASYSESIKSIDTTIDTYNLEITKFTEAAGNTSENQTSADELIDSIHDTIISFAKEARVITQEYYANQMNQCISGSVQSNFGMSNLVKIAFVLAAAYVSFWTLDTSIKLSRKENDR